MPNHSPFSRRERPVALAGLSSLILLAFGSTAFAQGRTHELGLTGDMPPDISNWPHPAAPDGNPFPRSTATPAELRFRNDKARLGKILFWDEQVSTDNTMACGTCHFPEAGGTDMRPGGLTSGGNLGSFGVIPQTMNSSGKVDYGFVAPPSPSIDRQVTDLHAPTMIGAYMFNQLFWDRRAGPDLDDGAGGIVPGFDDWAGLEDQAHNPPSSPVEMGHENIDWTSSFIQKKLAASKPLALVDPTTIPPDVQRMASTATYAQLFDQVFFNDPQFGGKLGVTRERFSMAIAHYERTLIPDQAPIDQGTMTPEMVRGFDLVFRSGCFFCHSKSGQFGPRLAGPGGPLVDAFDNPLSDGQSHDIGFGRVKTPTLRNVGLRRRFFSTGQGFNGRNTLDDIVTFYDLQPLGGIFNLDGSGPGGTLTPQERADVLAFLGEALTDPRVAGALPPFDRPPLASERPEFVFEGNEYGVATPGPSGTLPEIIANAVPHVPIASLSGISAAPRHWFKVGVGNAMANTPAVLMVSLTPGPGPVVWVGPSTGSLSASVMTNSQGIATHHSPFPLNTSTIGTDFFVQWMIMEPLGRAFSDAATFRPFQF